MKIIKNKYFPLIILRIIAVILIIAFLFIVKFIGGELFENSKSLYIRYFEDETLLENDTPVTDDEQSEVNITNYTVKLNKSQNSNMLISPLKGIITSRYGMRNDPFTSEYGLHTGIDIAADYGSEIISAATGNVEEIGYDSNGYGNYVIISHGNNLKTLYAHCSTINISQGDEVEIGQKIACVGSTGRSTGNHLHFEIIINSNKVNPEWYISFEE